MLVEHPQLAALEDAPVVVAEERQQHLVVQIGVQFLSGFSSGGGTFMNTGTAVFDIDTVTD